jgi:hypothetical protein
MERDKMKKILLSMAAISAVSMASAGMAQYQRGVSPNQSGDYRNWDDPYGDGGFAARIDNLQARIQAGVQSGAITRQEAGPLRLQLRQLIQLERRYSANGLSPQERADLQQRIRSLRQQVRVAAGGMRGYDQDDRDGYGQNGGYDRRFDRNNDGFDDRDYNRDGRRDDIDDNGDDYQQPAQRGGIGGLIDGVLGGGGLRVGQRAPANLNGLPSEYRSQYRDGGGVYYRSDGRSIYEIDARTQAIVRVYPMDR